MNKEKGRVDPRFSIAHSEALLGVALVIINFVWWFGFAYGLGSASPDDYQYILGMPAWFFYSCVVGSILMIVLVSVLVKGFFREVPFDEEREDQR